MKAVVLAGGQGSRLLPYTDLMPKVLLSIGSKPIIEHVLGRLLQHGFDDILLCINKAFYNNFEYLCKSPWNVKLSVSPKPMGTGGELYNAKGSLLKKSFLIHYGDEITTIDLAALKRYHERVQSRCEGYMGSLALVKGVPMEVGVVRVKGNLVTKFDEKPKIKVYTWTGIAILNPKILEYCKPDTDLGADVFPTILSRGHRLYAYKSLARWYDIGQLHHLRLVEHLIMEGKLKL